jgi:hypothetical protein
MTQQTNKAIRTSVGWVYDKTSEQVVVAGGQKVAATFQNVADATKGFSADVLALNPELAKLAQAEQVVAGSAGAVASANTAAATAARSRLSAIAQEKVEVQDLTRLYASLEQQQLANAAVADTASSGGSSLGRNITRVGRGIFNLPDVPLGGGLSSTMLSRGLMAGGAGVDALGLTVAQLGLLGAVGGVAAIALMAVNKSQEEATKSANDYADALERTAGMTSEDVRGQIKDQEDLLASYRAGRETLQGFKDQLNAISNAPGAREAALSPDVAVQEAFQAQFTAVFDAASAASGTFIDSTGDINAALEEADTRISEAERQLGFLNVTLESTPVKAADAQAAIETFQDQLAEATAETTNKILSMAQLSVQIENQSAEAREQSMDALRVEILTLERFRDTVPQTEESLNNLNDQIDLAREKLDAYAAVTRTYGDYIAQQEAVQKNFNDSFEAMGAAQEKYGQALEKVNEAQERLNVSQAEHEEKLQKIDDDATAKAEEARKKSNEKAEEDERKHLQRIAEIEQRYNYDAEAAVGNRDALALYKAQQKRQEDLDKEQANYAERQKVLETQLDGQLETIREAAKKAADTETASYNKRQAQLERALRDAQAERDRWDSVARAYERQANIAEVNDKLQHLANMKTIKAVNDASEVNAEYAHAREIRDAAAYGRVGVFNEVALMFGDIQALARSYRGSNGLGGPYTGSQSGGVNTGVVEKIVDKRVAKIVKSAYR